MTRVVADTTFAPLPIDPAATLVVTRPMADARRLVDALTAAQRRVIALPVLAIESVADPTALATTMARVEDYRVVIFVSPNAIRHALAERAAPWPRSTAIGVMGPGSVATLADQGIASPAYTVIVPLATAGAERFDSEALFESLDAELGPLAACGGRVLILRGNGGRGWLVDRLRAAGIAVDEVEAYRRTRPEADAGAAEALVRLFEESSSAVFIVTSSEGVDNLVTIVENALAATCAVDAATARRWLFAQTLLAPHRRIAEKARRSGFSTVSVCAPGDRGILAAIE